ncbi:MAG: ABC transporter permease [Firmicutes bacterium]|nr:ABC transporter permease [Bacillota bacterium]
MPVFKLCLKIINKNKMVMMVYILAFVMVSFIVRSFNKPSEGLTTYSDTKVSIAIISEEDTPLTKGIETALSRIAEVKSLEGYEDNLKETIQDALYFRALHMVITIPEGFTDAILAGEPMTIKAQSVPGSVESMQVNLLINQYLNLARLYVTADEAIGADALASAIASVMDQPAEVTIINPNPDAVQGDLMPFFFNYLAYSYMFVMILGVSSIMLVFNRKVIKWRNACGPMPSLNMSAQLLLAIAVFAVVVWLILVTLCLVFDSQNAFKTNTLYFMLNAAIFGISVLGLSFLLANLIKGKDASSAVANIITLSTCFLSGVFVPQAFLGEGVLKVASYFPTYWYVKANTQIAVLTRFSFASLKEILGIFLIELGFAAAFIIVSLAVGKRNQLRT